MGFLRERTDIVYAVNISFCFVSIILLVVILIAVMKLKNHSKRMGWFIAALCFVAGGLASELMVDDISVVNVIHGGVNIVRAQIFYSFVASFFCLYFIETERDEGQEWDGMFWTSLNLLIAVLVIIFSVYDRNGVLSWVFFLVQYVMVIAMLCFSSKDIRASMGFMAAACFPVAAAFFGMAGTGLNLTGFSLLMMLMIIFFGYQADVEKELLKKRTELSESRVSLLMEQIHPHFIYNSLQQIASYCDEEPAKAKEAIIHFSGYLRSNFQSLTSDGMIPFEKEMQHVEMFLELAKYLPSRKFTVERDFQVMDFSLPALTLQPLVENAIQYGIGMSTEGERILIQTKKEGGYIILRVVDDGHGEKTKLNTQKKHVSVGTKNVRSRLKLMCEGELDIRPLEQGTEAVIKIPLKKED